MTTRPHVPVPEEVNVNVVVRVRPPLEREKQLGYTKCVSVDPLGHSLSVFQPPTPSTSTNVPFKPLSPPQPTPRTFTFDYVADEFVTQEEMFTSVGKPMVHACLQGYHCCLIAYGQTGAGKTYTMEGPSLHAHFSELDDMGPEITEKCGLIPRILETIFLILAAEKAQSGVDVEFSVRCSSLQIYNEQVEDLLCPDSTNLTIHEDAKIGMYVEGLQEIEVQTPEATYEVLKRGSLNRHVGATAMNAESSRSHGVFILSVESQALLETTEGKIRHIPYRDSKLTYLLKDALGGNSKCTLIANISPSIINLEETLSTLKFAQRAKYIKNVAIVNEDTLGNGISAEEVKRLRLEIAALRARINSTIAGEQSISWNDHSASNQVRRLEYIISQSTKQALAGERKTAQEMHALTRKMDALKSLYLRLDRTLQGFNGSTSQKQRKRDTSPSVSPPPQSQKNISAVQDTSVSIPSSDKKTGQRSVHFKDLNDGPQQVLPDSKRHSGTSSTDDKFEDQRNSHLQDDNPAALKSQIAHLKTMNKSLKLELENLAKEKKSIFSEFSEVKRDRDQSKKRLASLEDQIAQLQNTIEKLQQQSDKESQSSEDDDEEHKALVNFQKKKHIQAFKRFITRPRIVEVRQKKPGLLCRLLRRKKRPSLELLEEA